jgi:gamma-glutamylcyclotransferase (GGCT)/AIG2-like uncharacterized protein YtfP
MAEYLFTYGTLQPGHAPAMIASAAARLLPFGEGRVQGTLYDFGRYPGAVLDADSGRTIFGTIYELPDDPSVLSQLDDYEDCYADAPALSQYLRVLHPVALAKGETLHCWIYVYNRDVRSARVVESGRWARRAEKDV